MNLKKITAGVMAAVIVVTGAAGCTGKKAEEGKKGAKGKYVEKEAELPKNEAENGIGMVQIDDKTLRYYTRDKNTGEGLQIVQGEDGKCYAWYMTGGSVNHVLREGDSTEIPLPELAEPGERGLNIYVSAMKVDRDGNIYLADPIAKKILMYGPEGGDRIRSFDAGASDEMLSILLDIRENSLLVMNDSGDGFLCYDTQSGEVTSETKYAGGITGGNIRLGNDKDIYYTDAKGIHHLTLGGTVSEDLVDGNASALGNSGYSPMNLFFGGKSQYYVFAAASDTSGVEFKLYEYTYDKDAKAIPDETLTIYGLTESKTVRQAIASFQQKHPDVGIEYKTGNTGEGTATKEDSIRALNTELLAGNGADVIMLDGLPVQSYVEKGVLEDLSEIVKAGGLLQNIVKSYEQDGKIYQIPARIGIPIMAGDQAKTDALKSADALKAYMKSNPASEIFDGIDSESVMKLLIDINYENLVDKDLKVQTQELASLMELAKQFSNPESEDVRAGVYTQGGDGAPEKSDWDVGDTLGYAESGTVMSQEIKGIMGMMVPFYSMRNNQEKPTDVNGAYVPHDIAGVNKAAKQKELAQEFVEILLSEEIQSLDMEEGFPVNEKAMEAFVQSVEETPDTESGIQIGISSATEDGNNDSASITLPPRSEVEELNQIAAAQGQVMSRVKGSVAETTLKDGMVTTGQEYVRIGTGGYQFQASVEAEDLERLKTGDELHIQLNGRPELLKAKITQISAPKQGNENGGAGTPDNSQGEQAGTGNSGISGNLGKITAKLPDGEYPEGTQGEYSIEKESDIRYNFIIPVNALREDQDGAYCLAAKKKNTILGEEYVAERINLTKKAKDVNNIAVEGVLTSDTDVIIESTKEIQEGDRFQIEHKE